MDPAYQPINIPNRDSKVLLSADLDISISKLFLFFITKTHFNLIFADRNINVNIKCIINWNANDPQKEKKERKESSGLLTRNTKHI